MSHFSEKVCGGWEMRKKKTKKDEERKKRPAFLQAPRKATEPASVISLAVFKHIRAAVSTFREREESGKEEDFRLWGVRDDRMYTVPQRCFLMICRYMCTIIHAWGKAKKKKITGFCNFVFKFCFIFPFTQPSAFLGFWNYIQSLSLSGFARVMSHGWGMQREEAKAAVPYYFLDKTVSDRPSCQLLFWKIRKLSFGHIILSFLFIYFVLFFLIFIIRHEMWK